METRLRYPFVAEGEIVEPPADALGSGEPAPLGSNFRHRAPSQDGKFREYLIPREKERRLTTGINYIQIRLTIVGGAEGISPTPRIFRGQIDDASPRLVVNRSPRPSRIPILNYGK